MAALLFRKVLKKSNMNRMAIGTDGRYHNPFIHSVPTEGLRSRLLDRQSIDATVHVVPTGHVITPVAFELDADGKLDRICEQSYRFKLAWATIETECPDFQAGREIEVNYQWLQETLHLWIGFPPQPLVVHQCTNQWKHFFPKDLTKKMRNDQCITSFTRDFSEFFDSIPSPLLQQRFLDNPDQHLGCYPVTLVLRDFNMVMGLLDAHSYQMHHQPIDPTSVSFLIHFGQALDARKEDYYEGAMLEVFYRWVPGSLQVYLGYPNDNLP